MRADTWLVRRVSRARHNRISGYLASLIAVIRSSVSIGAYPSTSQ
jgi:hypothetical protein